MRPMTLLIFVLCIAAASCGAASTGSTAGALALGMIAAAPDDTEPSEEARKVLRLLHAVEQLRNATFVNEDGVRRSARDVASRMRIRYKMSEGILGTARQFIEYMNAGPYTDDTLYQIKLADGTQMSSTDFLFARLEEIESAEHADAAAPPDEQSPSAAESGRQQRSNDLFDRDPQLWALVNRTIHRINGETGWAAAHCIRWTQLGQRTHLWDRQHHRDRIDFTDEAGVAHVYVIDLNTRTGTAWIDGESVTDADALKTAMTDAQQMWAGDRWWLCAPLLLFEPGVKLKNRGNGQSATGVTANIVELTFTDESPGGPFEKILLYARAADGLVMQWDCYEHAQDRAPILSTPWTDWTVHGPILLSGNRGEIQGERARLTNIAVYESVPAAAFTSPAPPLLPEPMRNDPQLARQLHQDPKSSE